MRDLTQVIHNALKLKDPSLVWSKINERLHPLHRRKQHASALDWCSAQTEQTATYAKGLDPIMWREAEEYAAAARERAATKLADLSVRLGGGGHYPLIYFLIRYLKPETVVETRVAAGYSSHAILSAMHANNKGTLWSSDLPYLRLENPEEHIGLLVDDAVLKRRWRLFLDGDTLNLDTILKSCEQIDLVSYDSDKSYKGRKRTLDRIMPKLSPRGIILVDDIEDNLHFRDFVEEQGLSFRVFEFSGKYVGLARPADN